MSQNNKELQNSTRVEQMEYGVKVVIRQSRGVYLIYLQVSYNYIKCNDCKFIIQPNNINIPSS